MRHVAFVIALTLMACGGGKSKSVEMVPFSVLDGAGGKGGGYADFLKPPQSVQETASGLRFQILKKGDGTRFPEAGDTVVVHYTGWTMLGRMFDSSLKRGAPASLLLPKLIQGWQEGIPMMVIGEKRRLWVPAKLAYADSPSGPQGPLVFDIELLDIK